ncbi:MAG TPA: FAD-dependent oxidoreductase, partial [Sphingopyxis sp.]|nr:FAD-dependent oxidoreductase [Sphingopyxis sp.]
MSSNQNGLSRREAIVMAASGVAVAGMPGSASAKDVAQTVDVIIVGAGFAGLTAARELRRAGQSVVVLEADDRVGGRTKAATLAGETIDIGGQWVGPTQTHLLALAKDYGVRAVPQYADGENIIDIAGRMARYRGETPGLADADLAEFGAAVG